MTLNQAENLAEHGSFIKKKQNVNIRGRISQFSRPVRPARSPGPEEKWLERRAVDSARRAVRGRAGEFGAWGGRAGGVWGAG